MKREEVKPIYKWDLSDYCKDEKEVIARFEAIKDKVKNVTRFEGKLGESDNLINCLKEITEISIEEEIVASFVLFKKSEDGKNSQIEKLANYISKVGSEIATMVSFVHSEIAMFDDETILAYCKKPEFASYKYMLESILRARPHLLSKQEEKLLSKVGEALGGSGEVFDAFDTCDVQFDDVLASSGEKLKLTNSNYSLYVESDDKMLRRSAHENMQTAYGKFEKTIGTNYICSVIEDEVLAKIKNYSSALDRSMFQDHIPTEIYNTLIRGVEENLPVFQKYFAGKKKLLGLDDFCIADCYAKTGGSFDKKFTFEQAMELVKAACKPLGDNYVNLLGRAFDERWIDVYPTENKATGAFASGAYSKHPVVLLNFNGSLDSVFTLAHELGHALHTYHSDANNCYEMASYSIFVAEVASTTNEMLLLKYLLAASKNDEEKLFLLDKYLSMYKSTVLRQVMFASFEEFAHGLYVKNGALSCEDLTNHYLELNQKYFGKDVKVFDFVKYEWLRIPHFYNSFYVYKYATGLISADILSNQILNGKTEEYITFLSSGHTLPPDQLLKAAGVDLTDKSVFDDAFKRLDKVTEQYCDLVKKHEKK